MDQHNQEDAILTYEQRNIYVYSLGHSLFPLDWELCFYDITEYKEMLARKYALSEQRYEQVTGGLDRIYTEIDGLLRLALEDAQATTPTALRCPPMMMALPRGDASGRADFVIILKLEADGETLVYSPLPLDYLAR